MTWHFEREGRRMRCDIRRDHEEQAYELVLTLPDGQPRVERFLEPRRLVDGCVLRFSTLLADGWRPAASV